MRRTGSLLAALLLSASVSFAQQRTPTEMFELAKSLGNSPEAFEWARKAADGGVAEAWFYLAQRTTDDAARIEYYAKSIELGDDEGLDRLLEELLFRAAEKADVVRAKHFGDIARRRSVRIGYDSAASLETIDACFEAGAPEIPAADRPTEAERSRFEFENCEPFLSPVSGRPDYRSYRLCRLSQPMPENRWIAEIYANGWGTTRNPKLALALICHGNDVPAELIKMVEVLSDTMEDEKLEKPFLFCDHVLSGMNSGMCAARGEEIDAAKRDAAWKQIVA